MLLLLLLLGGLTSSNHVFDAIFVVVVVSKRSEIVLKASVASVLVGLDGFVLLSLLCIEFYIYFHAYMLLLASVASWC